MENKVTHAVKIVVDSTLEFLAAKHKMDVESVRKAVDSKQHPKLTKQFEELVFEGIKTALTMHINKEISLT